MKRVLASLASLVVLVVGCGGSEVRTFQVTYRTVRSCHPAGLFPQLCEDPGSFAGKTRNALIHVEQRGGGDFVLYEEDGRALPGRIERGYYFARQRVVDVTPDGCERYRERSVKFELRRDFSVPLPNRPRSPDAIIGTTQDRSGQSGACGQPADSKFEEAFDGTEVEEESPWPQL